MSKRAAVGLRTGSRGHDHGPDRDAADQHATCCTAASHALDRWRGPVASVRASGRVPRAHHFLVPARMEGRELPVPPETVGRVTSEIHFWYLAHGDDEKWKLAWIDPGKRGHHREDPDWEVEVRGGAVHSREARQRGCKCLSHLTGVGLESTVRCYTHCPSQRQPPGERSGSPLVARSQVGLFAQSGG